jgi:hypothetical protein
MNISKTRDKKKTEMVKWLRELLSNKHNVISINIQILKKLLVQIHILGSKPKNIGVNSVIRRREATNAPLNHTSVQMKMKSANAKMVSYISVNTKRNSSKVCNTTRSIEIKLLLMVKELALPLFLVIHYHISTKNAGANHGNLSHLFTSVVRVTSKSKQNAQPESTSISVDTWMDPLNLTSMVWLKPENTFVRTNKMKNLLALTIHSQEKIHNLVLESNASVTYQIQFQISNTKKTNQFGSKKKRKKKKRKTQETKLRKLSRLKKKLRDSEKKLLKTPKMPRLKRKESLKKVKADGSETKKKVLLNRRLLWKNNSLEV